MYGKKLLLDVCVVSSKLKHVFVKQVNRVPTALHTLHKYFIVLEKHHNFLCLERLLVVTCITNTFFVTPITYIHRHIANKVSTLWMCLENWSLFSEILLSYCQLAGFFGNKIMSIRWTRFCNSIIIGEQSNYGKRVFCSCYNGWRGRLVNRAPLAANKIISLFMIGSILTKW